MRILITGATGNVAEYVIRRLESENELVLFSRTSPGERPFRFSDRHPYIRGDLTNGDDCARATSGCDAVVHLGGMPRSSGRAGTERHFRAEIPSAPPVDDAMIVNSLGTYNVMRAAVNAGVKVVIAMTSNAVLGHTERSSGRPFAIRYLPIDEDHPRDPESSYALSKCAQEQVLEAFARLRGIRSYALRPSWIWRPELQREHAAHVTATEEWSEGLLNGYVDMEDVARCVQMCLSAYRDLPPYDAYYLSAADTIAREDSLGLVRRLRPDLIGKIRDLPGRSSFISPAKAARAFGWKPESSWTRFTLSVSS
jgi:nucleoside-diphosphate-sugar epimerase